MNKHFKFQVLKQKLLANFIFIIFLANVIKLKHSWDRFGKFIEMVKIELSGNFAILTLEKNACKRIFTSYKNSHFKFPISSDNSLKENVKLELFHSYFILE